MDIGAVAKIFAMTTLFAAKGLLRRFGGIYALHNVNITQAEGETLGMIGPNGSGKTSFINGVTGHLDLEKGSIEFAGRPITHLKPHQIAKAGLVRTYQAVRVFPALSVRNNIATAALMLRSDRDPDIAVNHYLDLINWLQLDRRLDMLASGLSLFEQRRLEIAMRLVLEPRLIMLDEPVGGLSPREIRDMMQILQELKKRSSLFIIEHTMRVIRELADRVVVLISGQKIADGPPRQILMDKQVIEHYLGTQHA
jgi:ABC-type branched-subunit amino acid transport system ATPase component